MIPQINHHVNWNNAMPNITVSPWWVVYFAVAFVVTLLLYLKVGLQSILSVNICTTDNSLEVPPPTQLFKTFSIVTYNVGIQEKKKKTFFLCNTVHPDVFCNNIISSERRLNKGKVQPKYDNFCNHSLTLIFFKTCRTFFSLVTHKKNSLAECLSFIFRTKKKNRNWCPGLSRKSKKVWNFSVLFSHKLSYDIRSLMNALWCFWSLTDTVPHLMSLYGRKQH